jgi:hypothetical protein
MASKDYKVAKRLTLRQEKPIQIPFLWVAKMQEVSIVSEVVQDRNKDMITITITILNQQTSRQRHQ